MRGWLSESYDVQSRTIWPGRGNHILAQYDDESVVVYQMFNPKIAEYAVSEQKFTGCREYNETRMTWIKTNFLWAMYRSGWATKPNQTSVLAIFLKRDAFERYLELARCHGSVRGEDGTVRLQWDPDHSPLGAPHPYRRAVQLGLRGISSYASGDDILEIQDISPFVHAMRTDVIDRLKGRHKGVKSRRANSDLMEHLLCARERVYRPSSDTARQALGIDDPSGYDPASTPQDEEEKVHLASPTSPPEEEGTDV